VNKIPKPLIHRGIASLVILVITLTVSIIWQKMVYTIPVLGVLLFFAAGLRNNDSRNAIKQLDQEVSESIDSSDISNASG